MVEGESGILATAPPWNRPKYEASKRRLTWPNGAVATTYSADKPDQLRGPQHTAAWADELAAWRYVDAWDQLKFGLRLGNNPQAVITTTPRPTAIIRELLAGQYETVDKRGRKRAKTVAVTRGSTFENKGNLAPQFLDQIVAKYEGTRLGRQELFAEVLDDTPGALWKRAQLEALYVKHAKDGTLLVPQMQRIVVAIDPAVSVNEDGESAETGIISAGLGTDDLGYVLDDLSGLFSPNEWASNAVAEYTARDADRIVAEVNNGGNLVEATIRTVDTNVSYRAVHASKGKQARAEPIAALYEQKKCRHVGAFPELEDQMTMWVPGVTKRSPDRLDAMVWAFTDLMLNRTGDGEGLLSFASSRR